MSETMACPGCGVNRKDPTEWQLNIQHADGCKWLATWNSPEGREFLLNSSAWKYADKWWKKETP
jgi:hypothetical protein